MADDKKVLIATPAGRDRAIERLQDHYAKSHLEVAEYERRVELAESATTDAALGALFDDLPPPDRAIAVAVPPGQGQKGQGPVVAIVSATLGSTSRRGRWRVPSRLKVRAILGHVEVDLSEAELSPGETVLDVSALLGSVVVTVPEGLAVECEGNAILGSFDHLVQGPASRRDGRRVRVFGSAKLGSVDIIVKRKTGVLEEIKSTVRGLLGG